MSDKQGETSSVPEEFATYEEAAEFWERHDTTEMADAFETVSAEVQLKRRRYEIEIDADLIPALTEQAHEKGMPIKNLVSNMLPENLTQRRSSRNLEGLNRNLMSSIGGRYRAAARASSAHRR